MDDIRSFIMFLLAIMLWNVLVGHVILDGSARLMDALLFGSRDRLVPLVFLGIWMSTMIIVISLTVLAGAEWVWLAVLIGSAAVGTLAILFGVLGRRAERALEKEKLKRKSKRIDYKRLPY